MVLVALRYLDTGLGTWVFDFICAFACGIASEHSARRSVPQAP